jgi:hypothetical protein
VGADRLDRQVVCNLIETKTPLVLRDLPNGGQGWTVSYALFGRAGFTPAAVAEAARVGGCTRHPLRLHRRGDGRTGRRAMFDRHRAAAIPEAR